MGCNQSMALCNSCSPGTRTCSGTSLSTCAPDGQTGTSARRESCASCLDIIEMRRGSPDLIDVCGKRGIASRCHSRINCIVLAHRAAPLVEKPDYLPQFVARTIFRKLDHFDRLYPRSLDLIFRYPLRPKSLSEQLPCCRCARCELVDHRGSDCPDSLPGVVCLAVRLDRYWFAATCLDDAHA